MPSAEKARELSTWISEEGPAAGLDLARQLGMDAADIGVYATAFQIK